MDTKPLLFGLIGFMLGGLLVSVAATTFDKPNAANMSMDQMSSMLANKQGDEYDKAFIEGMIEHHEGAITMAKQSVDRAKHDEIKQLSRKIIIAQEKEITMMKQWQADWGYSKQSHSSHTVH